MKTKAVLLSTRTYFNQIVNLGFGLYIYIFPKFIWRSLFMYKDKATTKNFSIWVFLFVDSRAWNQLLTVNYHIAIDTISEFGWGRRKLFSETTHCPPIGSFLQSCLCPLQKHHHLFFGLLREKASMAQAPIKHLKTVEHRRNEHRTSVMGLHRNTHKMKSGSPRSHGPWETRGACHICARHGLRGLVNIDDRWCFQMFNCGHFKLAMCWPLSNWRRSSQVD